MKTPTSLLSFRSGPVLRVSGRRRVVLGAGKRDQHLHLRLLALAGCSGKLSRILAEAAQSAGDLSTERGYAAQPAIALKLDRGKHEHFTFYVSPSSFRPLVVIVHRDHHAATARLYLNRITPHLLRRFHFPLQPRRRFEP